LEVIREDLYEKAADEEVLSLGEAQQALIWAMRPLG
jgi:hypothetical protein